MIKICTKALIFGNNCVIFLPAGGEDVKKDEEEDLLLNEKASLPVSKSWYIYNLSWNTKMEEEMLV